MIPISSALMRDDHRMQNFLVGQVWESRYPMVGHCPVMSRETFDSGHPEIKFSDTNGVSQDVEQTPSITKPSMGGRDWHTSQLLFWARLGS